MQISYRWITELLGADPGVARVAEALTLGGLEVEHIAHHGAHLGAIVAARVLSSRPHPTSKNPLTLVTVDRGSGAPVEVVCGAPNVPPPGGMVAFAPLGATVFGKGGAPVTLTAKPISGFVSEGMLCAEDELGLGTDHDGIVHLDALGLSPGASLATVSGFEDHVLTLNVTPNRGDALCHLGVARDLSALLGIPLPTETATATVAALGERAEDVLNVTIDAPDGCPQYTAAVLRGVTVKPSPLPLRVRLFRLGVRPINNVVDVTNLVMLERGQPLHAFDLSLVRGARIVVRRATAGERMKTLDGIDRALRETDLVIADAEGAVALAGVMGGENSGIAQDTRDVVIECASFDPAGVRRSARRLAIRTESSHRFERGTDRVALRATLARAASLMGDLSGATPCAGVIDVGTPTAPKTLTLRPARANALLGTDIPRAQMIDALRALGCGVTDGDGDALTVTAASHRNDLEREVDLIEEVARVWGYGRLAHDMPNTRGARAGARGDWSLRRRLRTTLAAVGLDEAIHYVFVAPRDVTALGLSLAETVPLENPLSDERSVLRPSLLPRLCAALSLARRHGEHRVRLFEIGSVFAKGPAGAALPAESTRVAALLAGPRDAWLTRADDVDFYDLKGVVEALATSLVGEGPVLHHEIEPPPWVHPRRWAAVRVGGREAGVMGALHPDVIERLDLGRTAVVFELDASVLGAVVRAPKAKAPSRQPAVRRDVALAVPTTFAAGAIVETLREAAGPMCESVSLFDRYVGEGVAEGAHSLAFAITWRAPDRTLKDVEVDALAAECLRVATARYGASQR